MNTESQRTLVLLRHAKSSWDEPLPDHERPLNLRGRRDATAAGALLELDGWPELVLCSTAVRTRQTWQHAAEAYDPTSEVVYTERIYEASVAGLRALLAGVDDGVASLMLIGHGPGLPGLADELARPLPQEYKTCGLTRIAITGSWGAIEESRLISFDLPRG